MRRILVVDDNPLSLAGLETLVSGWGYAVAGVANGEMAVDQAHVSQPDLVITDLVLPGNDGLRLLRDLQAEWPHLPVILLAGSESIETAVTAMHEGACDYLTKPVDGARLRVSIDKALGCGPARRQRRWLPCRVGKMGSPARLLGQSPAMREVRRLIAMAAPCPASVLIIGETGTGKELVARTLHDQSAHAARPFVAINCAAIPETLLMSELFGHEKGHSLALPKRRAGYFELAHGGTIFLDEIAEMSLTSQATLLRVLDAGTLRRIGGRNHIEVDVRVLAATNKEPAAALKTGVLRDDLYYRLNVLTVALPALRERPEDIPLLTEAFVAHANAQYGRRIRAVNGDALDALMAHAWPGNVRELQNRIERAVLLCPDDVVTRRCLSLNLGRLAAVGSESDAVRVSVGTQLRDCKKELILRTFAWADQNRTRAANLLGVSPKTLHNKLRRYRQAAPDTVAVGSATGHDGHSHDDDRHSP